MLIEAEDGAEAQVLWRRMEIEGYEAIWCPGPAESGGGRCPLVSRGRCPLVEEADVVVATWPSTPAHRAVLEAQRRLHPTTPVIVSTSPRGLRERPATLDVEGVICRHASAETVLDAVDDVLADTKLDRRPG
ncbi:MAG TPA: hypothetical protein VKG43_11030 [Acidimicrobiales bacterium]|nr:hypothetical protein [Acidimicrobiales bacterium]